MKVLPHAGVSAAIGVGLWAATGDSATLPAALAAGVLPDLDHLLDYYNWYVRRDRRRLILFLHGWEYLAVGVLVYALAMPEPWLLAVVLGYASQIGADQIFNRVYPYTYFVTVRAAMGFRADRAHGKDVTVAYLAVIDSVPFGLGERWLRPWFERRIPPEYLGASTSSGANKPRDGSAALQDSAGHGGATPDASPSESD